MSTELDKQGLQSVEQSIRKRIRSNQCRIRCELPFSSQAGFASASTVGTDSSGGKSVSGTASGGGDVDTLNAITVNATNGCFENLKATQFTTENASMSTALIQQASIAQINGNINFNGSNMTNVNIDSGTIDNTVIGGDTPVDGTFTDLQANNSFTLLGVSGVECVTYSAETEVFNICGKLVVGSSGNEPGTIDNTIIGGVTANEGIFTELIVREEFTLLGSSGQECVTYSSITETLTVCGNLVVEGDTTTIQSETIVVEDVTIRLGHTSPLGDDNKDRGVEFGYHTGTAFEMGFMGWDNSNDKFTFLLGATNNNSEDYDGMLASVMMDTLCVNEIKGVSGNITINPSDDIILAPGNDIIVPTETNLIFGTSTSIYHSNDDLIISSHDDLLFDVSGSINVPADIPLEFGTTGYNIYGNTLDLIITSQNNINLDITGSLHLPANKQIEFGASGYGIYSDETDLIISSNGYVVLDAFCLAIGPELDCFICKDDGNLQIKNEGNTGDIELLTNENLLLNVSGSVQVNTSTPIEFGVPGNSIVNNGDDVIISAVDDIFFNTDCLVLGITADCMICKDNGNLEIINAGATGNITIDTPENLCLNVTGRIKIPENTPIEFGSPGYNIYSDNTDLVLTSSGYVVIDSSCLAIGEDLNCTICKVDDKLVIGATSGIVFTSSDIDIPIVKEYRPVSYKDFDVDGTICEVYSTRELVGGLPVWYWLTDTEESGTIYYAHDLSQNIRDNDAKGMKLTGVYYWFDIIGDSVNSVSSTITKSTMNPSVPGAPTLSAVTVDNTTLNTNTSIGTYYTKVDVTSSEYYNSHQNLTVEFAIDKKVNSVIKFYGIRLEFDKKYF